MTKKPINIAEWTEAERDELQIDLRANQLINGLMNRKSKRIKINEEIEKTKPEHREHFRSRLNHWREFYKLK